ncbi:hypothetical protein ABMC89_11525 [Sulfitobacter sp. HNIBRBA3233]|uniref:hypothetical protein n=1 Tax=Sulfitobacter marinivivus TaxID=3158558 RepID=UPI0032DF7511
MCNACGFPMKPGHWTDAGTDTPGDRLRVQMRRAQVLDRILTPYGLRARPPGNMRGFSLSSLSGKTTLVPDLEALWEEAARATGAPLDPLDPRFIGE